jgi:ATP-dependent RNA helicase RhlE
MPPEITSLARDFMKDPVRVEAAREGAVSDLVDHELLWLSFEDKPEMLSNLLDENDGSILIFSRTRHGARKLAKVIREQGHSAEEIHADRSLAQRREALHGFKSGRTRVLVATDIAARGIDVKEISLVVNYDLPDNPDDYLHRIGRTGRAGSRGRAVTLAMPDQRMAVRAIEQRLGLSLQVSDRSTITVASFDRGSRKPARGRRFGKVRGRG